MLSQDVFVDVFSQMKYWRKLLQGIVQPNKPSPKFKLMMTCNQFRKLSVNQFDYRNLFNDSQGYRQLASGAVIKCVIAIKISGNSIMELAVFT